MLDEPPATSCLSPTFERYGTTNTTQLFPIHRCFIHRYQCEIAFLAASRRGLPRRSGRVWRRCTAQRWTAGPEIRVKAAEHTRVEAREYIGAGPAVMHFNRRRLRRCERAS